MDNIVFSFSGGRSSALMTIEGVKNYHDALVVFSNTGKESEATLKFVKDVEDYIGKKIIWLEYDADEKFKQVDYQSASRNGEPFERVIAKKKFLPNRIMRFCTVELKINVLKNYCKSLGWTHWTNMVGIRYDEPNRWNKSKAVERNEIFDVEHPLVKWKITKQDVSNYWQQMPFRLEQREHYGNCDLCFLKGKNKKLAIARENPKLFDWWISQEKKVSGRFVAEYSYQQLLDKLKKEPELFDYDDSIECFCNID